MVEEGDDRVCQMEETGIIDYTPGFCICVPESSTIVADDSYARFLGFHGYLYPNVLA